MRQSHSEAHSKALLDVLRRELPLLDAISEDTASRKPSADRWSKKEELGHLIDSAANNHVRFVAGSLQTEFTGPGYAQDGWVERHGYQKMAWADIREFWHRYNLFLAGVMERVPEAALTTPCSIGDGPPVTLGFVMSDYVLHMRHHLDKILERPEITKYGA